jgi:PAS domain-containing protein
LEILSQARHCQKISSLRAETRQMHIPSLIFLKDLEGRHLMVNQGFERALGIGQASTIMT